jgi:hypothetical protein
LLHRGRIAVAEIRDREKHSLKNDAISGESSLPGCGASWDAPHAQERGRQEESMILALYIAAAVIMAVGSLYFAWQNRNFRKFLAGAFFVSSGILFYLYLADVSVPLLGTGFVETPEISAGRSIVHFILFVLCFYFGFVRRPKA